MRVMKTFALFITTLALACVGSAETLYTTLQETPVRDKPVALGSTVIARLKAGTMIETVKQVGAFTTVSFIQDGKVKTGFIQTSQIKNDSNAKVGAVEAAQTTLGAEDVSGMINGLSNEKVAAASGAAADPLTAAKMQLPAGSEDPGSLLASKLESLQVPAKDLATFAASGKLVARKPKGK